MANQLESARFQGLFETALQGYERKTGVRLAEHPLALRIQSCHSVDDVTSLLRGQAQAFNDFRENDKVIKSIETIVSVLSPLSSAVSLVDAFGVVRQKLFMTHFTSLTFFEQISPPKAIQAGLAILLDVRTALHFHIQISL
jgi:hypothetical protein